METLMLRDSCRSIGEHEKIKLRLATMDYVTNLLWIYIDSELEQQPANNSINGIHCNHLKRYSQDYLPSKTISDNNNNDDTSQSNDNNLEQKSTNNLLNDLPPFVTPDDLYNTNTLGNSGGASSTSSFSSANKRGTPNAPVLGQGNQVIKQRKILIIDVNTFDIFSAFTIPSSFGEITHLSASLVAYFQLANPMSNQFSSRIVQIGPNGHFEQLLSFSDVVDFLVSVPESFRQKYRQQNCSSNQQQNWNHSNKGHQQQAAPTAVASAASQKYSSLRRLLTQSMSFSVSDHDNSHNNNDKLTNQQQEITCNLAPSEGGGGTLRRYYKSLIKSYSLAVEQQELNDKSGETAVASSTGSNFNTTTLQDKSPSSAP